MVLKQDINFIVGVDAQVSIGHAQTHEELQYIGEAAENVDRMWKSNVFVGFTKNYQLAATHFLVGTFERLYLSL